VGNFVRVLPYLWVQRKQLLLSVVFALLVALFWSLNLSVAFPVVKVLLQGESLAKYVNNDIRDLEAANEKRSKKLEVIDRKIEVEKEHDSESFKIVSLQKDRARYQSNISSASRKLVMMTWVRSYIIPLLPGDQFDLLAVILSILLLATCLKGICIWIQEVLVGSAVELTAMNIRKECFRHVLNLDYETLQQKGTSQLLANFTYDMDLLKQGMTLLGGKIVREPLKAIFCIVGAFFVCWQLTLMSLLVVPVIGFVFYRIGRKLKHASHHMMDAMSRLYKTLEETFDSLKVVIAFQGGRSHRQRFHRESKEFYHKVMKIVRIDALTSPSTEALGLIAAFLALLPGAYLVLRGTTKIWGITLTSSQMDIAELSLLYVMLAGVIDPMRKLSTTYAKMKRGSAAADRVFGLLDVDSAVTEPQEPKFLTDKIQTISFEHVQFAYRNRDEEKQERGSVLEDVSAKVRAGEVIVVVGENGSGKSTLVNLLPRYFDPSLGSVKLNRIDLRDLRLKDLRERIGIVAQETLLFDETIYQNIKYGKPTATKAEIERAAEKAHVSSFVSELPEGLDTNVGEKGASLSGGQRQRIALARAILRDAEILILDEATSAIDAQSERLIHESLRDFVVDRTTFLITHFVSESILDFVDRIFVMNQGRLIAEGTHAELISSCEFYRRLYRARNDSSAQAAVIEQTQQSYYRIDGPQPETPNSHLPQSELSRRSSNTNRS